MRTAVIALALIFSSALAVAAPCSGRWRGYSYALGDGRASISRVTRLDDFLDDFREVRKRLGTGNFMWVRTNGKSYVIRDAAFLDRVRVLFAPVTALGPEMDRISREEEALDDELDALEDGPDSARDEAKMERLRTRLESVQRAERELDRREEALECEAEKKLWPMVELAIKDGRASRM